MLTTLFFEGKVLLVYPGETLLAALKRNHFEIAQNCNGQNRCGSCRIKLLSGSFVSDGKIITVQPDHPLEANACSLKMLTDGQAAYPALRQVPEKTTPEIKLPPLPEDLPVTLALDIGTTNIEAVLLENGKTFSACRLNMQTRYGDNIIDRIAFAATPGGREKLSHALLEETCLPLIHSLTETPQNIRQVFVAGNTVMTHFFFNADPRPLGVAPFQPEQTEFTGTAHSAGLSCLEPDVPVKAVPCISGFIGGDITAGLASADFGSARFCELYMDFGTNCEILLNDHGKYYALSAAAGPAFERNNARAGSPDTVRHITSNGSTWQIKPELRTPAGYCGTALVDLLAEGKRHGYLNQFAQWQKRPELPDALICSESLLAELVTAKAAIESGLQLLLAHAGISSSAIDTIYLAGNFAEHLNIFNAVSIGILPDAADKKFIKCGNAALSGTVFFSIDPAKFGMTENIRKNVFHINPAEDPDYMRLFTSAMKI